ncbi:MAG: hypothetical protein Q9216_006100 [Gyalolechia sp. 2 TL-2023]
MVAEYYEHETEEFKGRLDGVEKEQVALEQGGRVWAQVVAVVGDLERMLEVGMRALDCGSHEAAEKDGMDKILEAMKHAREIVDGNLRTAEERGWKLLVVCIGAEAEALAEGEAVLRNVLGVGDDGEGGEISSGAVVDRRNGSGGEERDFRGQAKKKEEDITRLNGHGEEQQQQNGIIEETDDDDDEPGPELLMSTQEEDELGQLRI